MTYILSAQRNQDDPAEADRLWQEYTRYLRDKKATLPPGAFELATSDWYYGFTDHIRLYRTKRQAGLTAAFEAVQMLVRLSHN
jgi:hypothetical protein